MEQILNKDKGSMKQFLQMLWKGKIPYLWIIGYIIISFLLTNISISVTEYTAEMFAGNVKFGTVILPFLLFQILNLLIASLATVVSNLCIARIDRNFRQMIWKKIVRLPLRFYGDNEPKELISRVTTDITVMSTLIMQVFVTIITTGYSVIVTLRKIGSYDQKLMISLITILPLNVLIAFIIGKFKFGINDIINKKNAQLTQTIGERTNNALFIKSIGNEQREYEAGEAKMKDLYHSNIVNQWLGFSTPMYTIAGMMQFIVIVMVGRGFYSSGALTLAQWIAYYGFATSIVNVLTAYCGYWSQLKASQGATKRVAQVMSEIEEDVDSGDVVKNLSGDINLKNVSFSYGEKAIFQELNLVIPKGKVTAVIGPSGSGKTTLMNMIERLYTIESGKILFGQQNISDISLREFRGEIAYVTQESTLFSGTIKDNLLYGIHREVSNDELENICKEVGILSLIESLEDGFQTNVGEDGSLLSGGQRQRISIARALLKKSNYLFMDEATAAMDINSKDTIWKSIYKIMKEKTVFMVTHDRQTVIKSDYIIVLENGKITDQGSKEEIAKRNTFYQDLVEREGWNYEA